MPQEDTGSLFQDGLCRELKDYFPGMRQNRAGKLAEVCAGLAEGSGNKRTVTHAELQVKTAGRLSSGSLHSRDRTQWGQVSFRQSEVFSIRTDRLRG